MLQKKKENEEEEEEKNKKLGLVRACNTYGGEERWMSRISGET